jgi:hypothetical protein
MKGMRYMLEFIMEHTLPKLSQTSLFIKFNETDDLSKHAIAEINKSKEYHVSPEQIPEIMALMKLNGDAIVKRALKAYEDGEIILIFNKETSQVSNILPYIIMSKDGNTTAYVFADKIVDKLDSPNEYTKLMAVIEAAYLARKLQLNPAKFISNRPLVLSFCNLYVAMVSAPLEQKMYMKGENLTKALLYIMAYYYRMIDGDAFDVNTLVGVSRKVVADKLQPTFIKQIGEEVKNMEDMSFMSLLKLITQINPIRYKDMDTMYMTYFVGTCGTPLIFGLENIGYLFLLFTSSAYKTGLTGFALNKEVSIYHKTIVNLIGNM